MLSILACSKHENLKPSPIAHLFAVKTGSGGHAYLIPSASEGRSYDAELDSAHSYMLAGVLLQLRKNAITECFTVAITLDIAVNGGSRF